MEALRIRRQLESETIPELKPWVGRKVEIIVMEDSPAAHLTGNPPAMATEQDWAKFFASASGDLIDPDLIQQYREFDRANNIAPQL